METSIALSSSSKHLIKIILEEKELYDPVESLGKFSEDDYDIGELYWSLKRAIDTAIEKGIL